jgi:hypothetical protein
MSDPNAPAWMQEVAQAGGWEQHHVKNIEKELELKKKELELFKELNKIQPEQWHNIKLSVQGLNEFVTAGGNNEIVQTFIDQVKETVTSNINDALSPLTNEINAQMQILLDPLNKLLSEIANNMSSFISSGPMGGAGAAWGGLIGGAVGTMWLGPVGGQIMTIFGSMVGLVLERYFGGGMNEIQGGFPTVIPGETMPGGGLYNPLLPGGGRPPSFTDKGAHTVYHDYYGREDIIIDPEVIHGGTVR